MSTSEEQSTHTGNLIADLTRRGLEVRDIEGSPFLVLSRTDQVEDLERLLLNPKRIRQNVTVENAASFVKYFNRFGGAESVVYIDDAKFSVGAIMDYHSAHPRWCSHRCTFSLKMTEEWQAWKSHNGQHMSQLAFAEFLENHLRDIVAPVGAAVLEAATNLSNRRDVTFTSKVRADNGVVQLSYTEEDKGPSGSIEIPQQFTLGLSPFLRSDHYKLIAKLRYRIKDTRLEMWYDLIEPERVLRDAFQGEVDKITSQLNDKTLVIHGSV